MWAEGGSIQGALFAAGAGAPERRFAVTPEDTPSDVAAPRPLAQKGGGFQVVYESDFYSGRRRNPVRRAFKAAGEPAGEPFGEPQPAFADFISVREPLAALAANGAMAVGGAGIGPVGDGFFLQFFSAEGDYLGEPLAIGDKTRALGGDLSATRETYVFTWNIRSGKAEKAFVRLYTGDGKPKAAPRELGATAGTPALGTIGEKALVAWIEPAPERRIRLLSLDPEQGTGGEIHSGPTVPEGVNEVALEASQRLLAWAEAGRIVVVPWPASE